MRRNCWLRGAVVAVASLLLLTPAGGAELVSQENQVHTTIEMAPRQSVSIDGDDDFETSSAVRSGDGTEENPYVISDWTIVPTEESGIDVRNIRSHVTIEEIYIPDRGVQATWGISLANATNVTVRDVIIQGPSRGIGMADATDVTIDAAYLGSQLQQRSETMEFGISVIQSENIGISNVTVPTADDVLFLDQSTEVVVSDSSFSATSDLVRSTLEVHGSNLTVDSSVFDGVELTMDGENVELSLRHNLFNGTLPTRTPADAVFEVPEIPSAVYATASFANIDVCGNVFEDIDATALRFGPYDNLDLRGNVFKHVGYFAVNGLQEGSIAERNRLTDTFGLRVLHADAEIHNNSFDGNLRAATFEEGADASENWWGDPSGPEVNGDETTGEGDPVKIDDDVNREDVTLAPNLTAPPETGPEAVDCGSANDEPGTERDPQLDAGVEAKVALDVYAQRTAKATVEGDIQVTSSILEIPRLG